jgi:hypothetical protein
MSKSLSILTASPKRLMYCARFANCHILRSLCRVLGSSTGSSTSISSRARFRAGIVESVPRATRSGLVQAVSSDDWAVWKCCRCIRGYAESKLELGDGGRDEGECGSHDDEEVASPNCGDRIRLKAVSVSGTLPMTSFTQTYSPTLRNVYIAWSLHVSTIKIKDCDAHSSGQQPMVTVILAYTLGFARWCSLKLVAYFTTCLSVFVLVIYHGFWLDS